MYDLAVVSAKGARRWQQGHPWIYRSDVITRPDARRRRRSRHDHRGKPIGVALWSPSSEISLRMVDRNARRRARSRVVAASPRRRDRRGDQPLDATPNAFRLVHGEGDACPSLICDRYDRWLVVQLMSAGLEAFRDAIVDDALDELVQPEGILARNDVALRAKEKLPQDVELLRGDVPEEIEVNEHGVRFLAAPWKRTEDRRVSRPTRESRPDRRTRARTSARLLQLSRLVRAAPRAQRRLASIALDVSAEALARAKENCARNGITNVELVEADTFDYLRERQTAGETFDTIVLDPPAFAKTRAVAPARAPRLQGHQPSRDAAALARRTACSPRAAASISRSRCSSRCCRMPRRIPDGASRSARSPASRSIIRRS